VCYLPGADADDMLDWGMVCMSFAVLLSEWVMCASTVRRRRTCHW
jgi:hypothetical protein